MAGKKRLMTRYPKETFIMLLNLNNLMQKEKHSRAKTAKRWILSIAIAVVLTMFVNYAISTIFDEPRYENFCTPERTLNSTTAESCERIGGKWSSYDSRHYPKQANLEGSEITGWCDYDYTCAKEFENSNEAFKRNGFITSIITGGIALIAGLIITLQSVSTGLSIGGILTLFIGTTSYWGYLSKYTKVGILGALLIILIWLGYKKLKE